MKIVGVRGATTCAVDEAAEIESKTRELLTSLFEANGIDSEDLVSIIFTATDDLTAAFPAASAREMGLNDVPLLGAREMAVGGSPERCVRVLIHCYSGRTRSEICHVYLEGAKPLRGDLLPDLPDLD